MFSLNFFKHVLITIALLPILIQSTGNLEGLLSKINQLESHWVNNKGADIEAHYNMMRNLSPSYISTGAPRPIYSTVPYRKRVENKKNIEKKEVITKIARSLCSLSYQGNDIMGKVGDVKSVVMVLGSALGGYMFGSVDGGLTAGVLGGVLSIQYDSICYRFG